MEIVLLEDLGCSPEIIKKNREKLELAGHVLHIWNKSGDMELLKQRVRNADIIILANMPLPREALEGAPGLKFIDVAFTGVDHIPLELAIDRHIAVSNASGYADEAVAELTVGLMIQLLRDLDKAQIASRTGKTKTGLHASQLKGKVVGIIGAGHIGKQTAALCKAFGARVIAHNRHPVPDNNIDENVSLKELLERSDIVTLHTPLTPETHGLIGKDELACMKKSAFLINTARGPVVDYNALANALNNNEIAGAALDVFEMEPPLPADYPLLQAKNVILTPHLAYYTRESMDKRAEIVFDNLYAWLEGKQKNKIC